MVNPLHGILCYAIILNDDYEDYAPFQQNTYVLMTKQVLKLYAALPGVAKWTECQPGNQRAASLIPSQGTCLGCGPGPQ